MSFACSMFKPAPQVLLLLFILLAAQHGTEGACFAQSRIDTASICFVSDTQEPLFIERLFLSYNRNAEARGMIFDAIGRLHPRLVVHLGDIVSLGSIDMTWEETDARIQTLRNAGIGFLPVPGNHEYLLTSGRGRANFVDRFPDARLTGYRKIVGSLGIVLLNSNFGELTEVERQTQIEWYRKTLAGFDRDSSIHFVIVACHHPPFTNSRIVSASAEVRDAFLPDFYRSAKCRVFLGGHAHAYEHFREKGKDFLVIGGGGGIQHLLRVGEDAKYRDLFSATLEKRMFHFLQVRVCGDSLYVTLEMLREDFSGFEKIPQLKFGVETYVRQQPHFE